MSNDNLVFQIMAFESGELSGNETINLFSSLISNGMAWKLQGSYGRTAARLIDLGYVDKEGNIIKGVKE